MFSPIYDITKGKEVRAGARRFKEKSAMFSARRKPTEWEVPLGLHGTQVMPGHILHFRCTLYKNYGLCEKCRHIRQGIRSSVWRNRRCSTEPKVLFADEYCKMWVSVRRSTIQHAKAGNRVVASQNFGEKSVAASWYGSLKYAYLGRELWSRK